MGPDLSPSDMGTPANGSSGDIDLYWARLNQIVQYDQEKTSMLQELLYRHQFVSQQLQQEVEKVHELQKQNAQYGDQIVMLQAAFECDPYVLVLIDGDGMIFQDEIIQAGEAGGRDAAGRLHSSICNHVQRDLERVPFNCKVVCRIYANVRGLAEVLCRNGVIDEVENFEQFTRGFTRGKILFDFVDVGPGKDRADEKIIETFKLYINDLHCRHIFFGCSHDNGYARLLEEHATEDHVIKKITLLEGVPFEKELAELPFKTRKFPGIFRETKIVNTNGWTNNPWSGFSAPTTAGASKNYNMISGLPSRFPPPPPSHASSVQNSPIPAHVIPDLSRTPSTSTLASVDSVWGLPSASKPISINSWAAKAAAPAPPKPAFEQNDYKPVNRDEVIARNRKGQRVDPPCKDYDKAEADRIKKIKMCNVHFLKGDCNYADSCTHRHDYKPTRGELQTLRLVARMAPCVYGSGCADVKCIYGHRCPAPPAKNGAKGMKSCIFGETCKFPEELHGVDTQVVKTLLIR